MYLGQTRAEQRRMERAQSSGPSLRTTVEQRRLERDAERIERQQARDLRRVQRSVPLPQPGELPSAVTPSGGSAVVTADSGDATAPGSGTSAGGGSANVTVAPGESGGVGILPLLAVGAALLLL